MYFCVMTDVSIFFNYKKISSCFGKETWFVKDKFLKKDPDKDLMRT